MKHIITLTIITLFFIGCDSKSDKRIDWSNAPLAPSLIQESESKHEKNISSKPKEIKVKRIDWSNAPLAPRLKK